MALQLVLKAPRTAGTGSFVLRGGGPVAATVTEQGLTDLSLNGTTVLFGSLQAESSGARFGIADKSLGSITSKAVKSLNARSAQVTHRHENGTAVFVYTLDGEDLTITATVTNRTGGLMTVLGFRTLVGAWTNGEDTRLLGAQSMNLQAQGISKFHPSNEIPIGAAYCIPTSGPLTGIGVCVYPINTGLQRTLVHWVGVPFPVPSPGFNFYIVPSTFRYPGADIAENPEAEVAAPIFSCGIHAGETYTCAFGIRVSADSSAQHLLTPYKTQFNATFGPCTYAAARDDRPMTASFPGDESALDPVTNPYGFGSGPNNLGRFDLSPTPWCDYVLPSMVTAGCQGVIFWTLNGIDTRFPGVMGGGINYNTDIHVLPTEVEANRPELLSRLQAVGMRLGRESRTAVIRSRATWTSDYTYPIAGTTASTVRQLVDRFATAIDDLGFTIFYCDSFPDDFNAHLLLKALRDSIGPTVLLYCETWSDVALVYGGLYRSGDPTPPYSYGDQALVELARWITPGTSVIVKESVGSTDPDYYEFLYQHNATPLLGDLFVVQTEGFAALLASLNATYLVNNQFPDS